jgi:chloride channel protein, CIC family
MTDPTPPSDVPADSPAPLDPEAMLRSRGFVVLLVFAAVIGLFVSLASWGFLELVHQVQLGLYSDLPDALGYSTMPDWWPIPILVLAGIPVAFAIVKLPGQGGHVPAHGLQVGSTQPREVPGVALAAFATLGLGLVLGPEAPLIAIGGGLAVFAVKLAKRDAPPQLLLVLAAAGSFAAISVIFGSPIVAAVLVIEASGLGGATLPLILVPGLIAAGVGSLVFIGISNWTALSTSAYSLQPLQLPHFAHPTWSEIGWTLALGAVGALVTFVIRQLGLKGVALVQRNHWLWIPAAGLVVALLALLFASTTTHGVEEVLFSGQDQLPGLVDNPGAWSIGALLFLILCKGLAWSACLGSFRGGPTFPAIFLGAAGGIAASHLPGMSLTPAVAVGMGVMVVSFLKLPLSAVIIATSLTVSAGLAAGPLIIVGVVVAYLVTLALEGRLGTGGPGTVPATG